MSVRKAREIKGWSQQELASRAGISTHTITNVEKMRPVRPVVKKAICEALGTYDVEIVVSRPVLKEETL